MTPSLSAVDDAVTVIGVNDAAVSETRHQHFMSESAWILSSRRLEAVFFILISVDDFRDIVDSNDVW